MNQQRQNKPPGSYARDRFMGEGLDPKDPKETRDPGERTSDAGERSSDPRGGGFDSQRTYADADYGRDDEAHRDAHAGYGRDPFAGRGERKDDTSSERTDDKPKYPAQVARDRWTDARPDGAAPGTPAASDAASSPTEAEASDADELPQRTLDTSAGGIGQHETAWQQNAGPMGVTERRYGQYGDGTSDAYRSGDASGYGGFRESRTGAPPEPQIDRPAPPRPKSARPARQS